MEENSESEANNSPFKGQKDKEHLHTVLREETAINKKAISIAFSTGNNGQAKVKLFHSDRLQTKARFSVLLFLTIKKML